MARPAELRGYEFIGCDIRTKTIVRVPPKLELGELACGDDGTVYAVANDRFVLAGRGARWKKLAIGGGRTAYSLAWFRERLYVATGDELLELARGELRPAALGAPELRYLGHLAARDGILVACGGKQAAYHDGKRWHAIA